MFDKLPKKQGLQNRIKRLGMQAIDKVLYPNSDHLVSGGGSSPWLPVYRREINDIAKKHEMRRYPGVGGGVAPGMTAADHHAAVTYI